MRRVFIILIFLTVTFLAALLGVGETLTASANKVVGPPPADFKAESVNLHDLSANLISGWFIRGTPGSGAVLLLHGVRGDRRQMLDRARFLNKAGYSALLIDLPAHGESSGTRISFGYREAEGVKAAMRYLSQVLPGERIALIGVSLGAASFVLSGVSPAPSAVVLESMYPTIEEAVSDRLELRFGSIGAGLAPLLVWQIPLWLDILPEQLRPIDRIPSLHSPILIASGAADKQTTQAETKRIFAAADQPKELWLVENPAHVDLYAFTPKEYESRVSAFLLKYLRSK